MNSVKKVKLSEPVKADMISVKMDHYFHNAYLIDLPLDSTPDHVWQEIFNRTWKSSRHLWDRKLYVIGDKLRLVTADSNVDEKLDWVKSILEQTNKEIDEYNKDAENRQMQMEEELKRQSASEEAKVEKIKDTLQRRFPTI